MVAAGVVGLIVLGTPRHARVRELDQQRVRSLQALSSTVESYYSDYGRLPASMDAMMSRAYPMRPATDVTDPVTQARYEYAPLDSVRYRLCATFASADSIGPFAERQSFWTHPSGRHCFELEVPPRRRVATAP